VWPKLQVPYVLVECRFGAAPVARAAVSISWCGVVKEGEQRVLNVTELLAVEPIVAGGGRDEKRLRLLNQQLQAMTFLTDNQEITRDTAAEWVLLLEEAVPNSARWVRRGAGTVPSATAESEVETRLRLWVAAAATNGAD
jgi:hypothetical protein